jgi:autotransporter-associated beta strand protein
MDGDGVTGTAIFNGGTLITQNVKAIGAGSGVYGGVYQYLLLNGTQMVATQSNSTYLTIVSSTLGGGNTNAQLGAGGAVFNVSSYAIGTTANLVDYTSGGTLTLYGTTGSLTLTGSNSFTGNVTINGGTLNANLSNATLTNSTTTPNISALGAPNTAHNVYVNNTGTLNFGVSNVLGSVSNIYIATTLIDNPGGTITQAAGAFNTLGVLNLSGGTINSNTGTFYLRQGVVIAGTSASTMSSSVGGGFNLLSSASGGDTFNVGVTNATATGDLLVTGNLLNSPTSDGKLIKTGAGNMVISGTDSFTGSTVVSAGTLTYATASSINNVALTNNATVVYGASGSIPSLSGTTSTAVTNISSNTLTITGGGSYPGSFLGSGTLNFSGGTMVLKSTTSIAPNLILSGSTLNLQDGVAAPLNVGGSLAISGATLNFDLGSGATSDQIAATGAATISGSNTINLDLITGQTLSAGTYTLISASNGLANASNPATFTLGTEPAGFNQYNLSSTATALMLNVTAKAAVPLLYWTGSASTNGSPSNSTDFWGYGSGLSTVASNWSNVSSGSVDALNVPGSITDVYFTATNANASSGTTLSTTLDGSYSVKGLFFNTGSSSITSVGINTNSSGNSLAVGSDGITVTSTSFAGGTISGAGSVVVNGSQTWANNSATLPLNVSTGISSYSGATTLTLGGSGAGGVNLTGPISNGGGTLSLVLGQTGVTTISGTNTFTGGVTLNSGTVVLGSAGALNSTTPNAVTFGSGSTGDLRLNGNSVSVGALNTNATVGTPIIENASSTAATLTIKLPSGTSNYAGIIQNGTGGGALSLATSGAGTVTLSGSETYTGATTVNSGTLILSGVNAMSGGFTINNGADLTLSGSTTAATTGAVTINNGGTLTLVANASNITGSGSNASSSAIGSPTAVNYANDLYTTNVQLRSNTSVTFANAGPTGGTGGYPDYTTMNFDVNNLGGASNASGMTLTLGSTTGGVSGFGTYNSNINVTGGNGYTLVIPVISNANATLLNLNASTANLSIPGGITSVSTLTIQGAGNTTIAGGVNGSTAVNVQSSGNVSIGAISGTSLTMSGTGTLFLTGTNGSYTGITDIKSGTINFASIANDGSNSALGNMPASNDSGGSTIGLLFEGGTLQYTGNTAQSTNRQIRILAGTTATIDASGNNSTGATLSFTAATAANLFENAGTRTLQLTGSNTGQNIFATGIINQGSNATSFIKSGSGTWVLTGSNTYTGTTQITGGTLSLNSSSPVLTSTPLINIAAGATLDISNNPAFVLSSGATLAGSGTVNGFYTHSAGILSPGGTGTVGTLSFNNDLTLAGGALNFDLNGSSTTVGSGVNDLIAVTGNLNLSAGTTSTVTVSANSTPALDSIYKVISYTGSLNGTGLLVAPNRAYTVITSQPGYVELEYTGGAAANLIWNSTSNQNWDTSTQNWYNLGTNSADLFYSGDNVAFNDSTGSPVATPQTTINIGSTVLPTSVSVNTSAVSYTFSGTGGIGGSAVFTKSGSSTLTVSTSNSYSGDTNITGGIVIVNNSANGGGLGTGNLNISSGASVQIGDGGADGGLANSAINDNGTLVFDSSSSLTLSGGLFGSGDLTVEAGNLHLGNVNTYNNTFVTGGIITASSANAFGLGTVTVNGGLIVMDFGTGGSTGYTYSNTFNLSGTAIETGGSKTSTLSGAVNLIGNTTINEDGGSSIVFGSTVTSVNNSSLTFGRGATFQGSVSLGTGVITGATVYLQPPTSTTITISSTIAGTGAVVHNGAGTTILGASNSYTGGTSVTSGTLIPASTSSFPADTNLGISGGSVSIAPTNSGNAIGILINNLTLSGTGTLNLNTNEAVIRGSSFSTVWSLAQTGYNGSGGNVGAWNGSAGITSANATAGYLSAAASGNGALTAVGVILNDTNGNLGGSSGTALYGTFGGVSTNDGDVLVKYTYYGDTNLSGSVDGSDYANIDNGYLNNLTGWYNGDFNYDGAVNGSDYTLMDNAFNSQGAQLSSIIASPDAVATDQIAGATGGVASAVPEPTSIGLLGLMTAGMLGRRRKRR